MRRPEPDTERALLDEAREALAVWGIAPNQWRLIGVVPGARGGVARPVVEIASDMWVLRRQSPDLTEDDTRFRHAFMAHLVKAGLPVPTLLPTPEGRTWANVRDSVYEMQAYRAGEPFASNASAEQVELAGSLLGQLHQASAGFSWNPHVWPEERSAPALASAYTGLIRHAGATVWPGSSAGASLGRVADICDERIEDAARALAITPSPPMLHIHGDYQPHNLAFTGAMVSAVFDFDAARWEQRVYELAYALLFFTGLRWDEGEALTPPRVDDGIDILLAQRFLSAYGGEAPPSEEEAPLLGDALTLVFPVALANGALEDLVFSEDFADSAPEEEALDRLEWADRFWLWLDRYRDTLAEAWENG